MLFFLHSFFCHHLDLCRFYICNLLVFYHVHIQHILQHFISNIFAYSSLPFSLLFLFHISFLLIYQNRFMLFFSVLQNFYGFDSISISFSLQFTVANSFFFCNATENTNKNTQEELTFFNSYCLLAIYMKTDENNQTCNMPFHIFRISY